MKKALELEKELFELVESKGEGEYENYHILDTSETPLHREDEGGVYRIYHGDGYCLDVSKEYCCEPDEIDEYDGVATDGYNYSWSSEWDGFKNIKTVEDALTLVKQWLNP